MEFKIIDNKTGKEPTMRVVENIAKKHHLMLCDIDQFAVCEDGQIILLDDCGNVAYCDMKRFSVEIEKELKGENKQTDVSVNPYDMKYIRCGKGENNE